MIALTPYRLLLVAGLLSLWSGFMAYGGWHECAIREEARQKVAADQAYARLQAETAKVDKASAQLATAEAAIQTQTIERTKYVAQVTRGRACLSAAAVGLLNRDTAADVPRDTGQPTAKSPPAPAATDTDVEYWAVQAQGLYSTCAARLNELITTIAMEEIQ